MHVVTGGAFNGKAKWVKRYYQLDTKENIRWISAYQDRPCPVDLTSVHTNLLVLEGVEQWVYEWVNQERIVDKRSYARQVIQRWSNWERQGMDRKLIIIGTDISKGIVPLKASRRKWRDLTGWFYQDLVNRCDRFDLIWYGIAKRLK